MKKKVRFIITALICFLAILQFQFGHNSSSLSITYAPMGDCGSIDCIAAYNDCLFFGCYFDNYCSTCEQVTTDATQGEDTCVACW